MACSGFVRGEAGQHIRFELSGTGLLSITGRIVTALRSTGEIVDRRSVTQQDLERGWLIEADHIYTVQFVRVPRHSDLTIQEFLNDEPWGGPDVCEGGTELVGPWVIWGH